MKKINIWLILLLFIITFGFYGIYWISSTNKKLKRINIKSPNYLTLINIGLILIIFLSFLESIKKGFLDITKYLSFIAFDIIIGFFLIFIIAWFIDYIYKFSKAIDIYFIKNIYSFFLLLIIPILGIIYIQNKFNLEKKYESKIISFDEALARSYIKIHKKYFSKELIINGLIKSGLKYPNIDLFLKKYY